MTSTLEITLFGEVTFRKEGEVLSEFVSRKAEALLVYLVCHEQAHQREALANLLWEDLPQKRVMANLRLVLTNLRKLLGDALEVTRHTVSWHPDTTYALDAREFQAGLADCQEAMESEQGMSWDTLLRLEQVLSLYQGDFLEGFHISDANSLMDWIEHEREQLRRQAIAGIKRLIQGFGAYRVYQQGLTWAYRLLELDPLEEESHRQVMWFLAQDAQRTAALEQYQRCCAMLEEEFGVEPAEQTVALYQRIAQMDRTPDNHLPPRPPFPLLGREREKAAVLQWLLREESVLFSLLGPGGVGKTFLTQHLAHELAAMTPPLFPDGIYYVELEQARTADQLYRAIATSLQLQLSKESIAEQVWEALADREMLLILDNLETLLPQQGQQHIATLLQHAPTLRVLVTSRERVNLRQERCLTLQGLEVPADQSQPSQEAASLQLLRQSAERSWGISPPSDKELVAMQTISQLVQGMPLALELAASWRSMMGWEEIADELRHGLDLLSTEQADVPERHRSMRAVFAYSWALLSAEEQRVLATLSVFANHFDRHAARAVAHASLPLLQQLVNKHLLFPEDGTFSLHSLLRQYVGEKALELFSSETESPVSRHAAYYLKLLEEADDLTGGSGQLETLDRLDRAFPNLQQAWNYSCTHGDPVSVALRAGLSLFVYCYARNHYLEGHELFEQLHQALVQHACYAESIGASASAQASDSLASPEILLYLRALALTTSCTVRLAERLGRLESLGDLEQELTRLILLLQPFAPTDELAMALFIRSRLHFVRSEWEHTERDLLAALALASEHHNSWLRRIIQRALGNLWGDQGLAKKAQEAYQQSADGSEQVQDAASLSMCRHNLGLQYVLTGQFAQAQHLFTENLRLHEQLRDRSGQAYAHYFLARLAIRKGDFAQGLHSGNACLHLGEQTREPDLLIMGWECVGLAQWAVGRTPEAMACLRQAVQVGEKSIALNSLAETYLAYVWTLWRDSTNSEDQAIMDTALQIARRAQLPDVISENLALQGWYACRQGQEERAYDLFMESYDIAQAESQDWNLPLPLCGLGHSHAQMGDIDVALRFLHEALEHALHFQAEPLMLFGLLHLTDLHLHHLSSNSPTLPPLTWLWQIQQHPASWHWTREQATTLWQQTITSHPNLAITKIQEQAETYALPALVQQILSDFET